MMLGCCGRPPLKKLDMPDLKLRPIVGWKTETTPAGYGFLTISFLPGLPMPGMTETELEKAKRFVQLGMSAEQCDLLQQDLQRMAEQLRAKRSGAN
jgi:hypothetical protein